MKAAVARITPGALGLLRPLAMPGRCFSIDPALFSERTRAWPFVMPRPDPFRRVVLPALVTPQWIADDNEIKAFRGLRELASDMPRGHVLAQPAQDNYLDRKTIHPWRLS